MTILSGIGRRARTDPEGGDHRHGRQHDECRERSRRADVGESDGGNDRPEERGDTVEPADHRVGCRELMGIVDDRRQQRGDRRAGGDHRDRAQHGRSVDGQGRRLAVDEHGDGQQADGLDHQALGQDPLRPESGGQRPDHRGGDRRRCQLGDEHGGGLVHAALPVGERGDGDPHAELAGAEADEDEGQPAEF